MGNTVAIGRTALRLASVAAGLMALQIGQAQLLGLRPSVPLPGGGEAPTGEASAITAVVFGNATSLAATGTLASASEPLGTGLGAGSIEGLVSAEALHAATMGWTDQVASEASLGNLTMTVAGTGISADFIVSRAQAVSDGGATGLSTIEGLSIGGSPVSPTGAPNQEIWLPGLQITLNEQVQTTGGIVVNALHVRALDGLIDIVVGSAKAGI